MNSASGDRTGYDVLLGEHGILRKKLESKTEALIILSNELAECRTERDQLRSLVEQTKTGRYVKNRQSIDNKILTQNLCECKEKNKILQIELKDLKQKLQDSEGDMKALREQIARQRQGGNSGGELDEAANQARHFSAHDRDCLVANLESVKMKYALLERDLQSVLDEKEELVTTRDAYKHKVDRLNHELHYALKGDDKKVIDIDSLLMENRYLQERLKQTQEEKSLYMQTLSKYKSILEKRRNKSVLKLGANTGGSGSLIVTHKQVEQMLQDTSLAQLPATHATIADLRSLALALFESLNDKNIALAHQKKTNKILGHRLAELEKTLSTSQLTCSVLEDEEEALFESGSDSPKRWQRYSETDDFPTSIPKDSDPTKKLLTEYNNNNGDTAVSADHNASEHTETLVRSPPPPLPPLPPRRRSTSTVDSRSPPTSPAKAFPTTKDNPYLYPTSIGRIGSSSDEDLPPKLRKLVQDAMDDLDRRLSNTFIESEHME